MAKDREHTGESQPAAPARRPLGRWRKAALIGSVVLMVAGLGMWIYAAITADSAPPSAARSAVAPNALAPMNASEPAEAEPRPVAQWSPVIFRLGFSFFVAFCMAYALRTFMKVAVLALGVAFLALFGLQYAGLVNVNWEALKARYDDLAVWVSAQTQTFKAFVTGYLPSAASAGAGFVAGFVRR